MTKITIFSRTPLAASPWELYKALKKYTNFEVSLVNVTNRYNDGRIFPYHLLWNSNNGQSMSALKDSDIWHIHNYLIPGLQRLHDGQKILAQFHSLPRLGNWRMLMEFADKCYTISQPLQEKEYRLPSLPNIIDPDEYYPIRRNARMRIAFAPSSKAPIGYPMSKGYHEVRKILGSVASKRDVEICWIEGKPYEENLKMKQRSHILVDDVVTGNYHRTSLEGLCFGCAVLNRCRKVPFVFASLDTLEERLLYLIDNPGNLRDIQERSRLWILQNWHPIEKIQLYTQAYKELLNEKD